MHISANDSANASDFQAAKTDRIIEIADLDIRIDTRPPRFLHLDTHRADICGRARREKPSRDVRGDVVPVGRASFLRSQERQQKGAEQEFCTMQNPGRPHRHHVPSLRPSSRTE